MLNFFLLTPLKCYPHADYVPFFFFIQPNAFIFFLKFLLWPVVYLKVMFNFLASEYFAIVVLLLLSALTPLLLENTLCSFNNFCFFLLLSTCQCQHFEADLYGQRLVGLWFLLFSPCILKLTFTQCLVHCNGICLIIRVFRAFTLI